jgi:hypothetical protein
MGRQRLAEFALCPWGRSRPGLVIDITPERLVELQPSWPIADVNVVARIRCRPERVDPMIRETRAYVASHHVACQWFVDAQAEPANLPEYLARYGILRDPEPTATVMVMGADGQLPPSDPRIEIRDALTSFEFYSAAHTIQYEAFGMSPDERLVRDQWERAQQDPTSLELLALYDGAPAGAANAIMAPDGWVLAGGATRLSLRGRGVFRALVRERWQRAIAGGAPGVAVHAGRMSAPILTRLGFQTVGELSIYRDDGTANSEG